MTRTVLVNAPVAENFTVLDSDGFTKVPGLNPSTQMVVTAYLNGMLAIPFTATITEISAPSGEYNIQFTPTLTGLWEIEIAVASELRRIELKYDVVANIQALPGQVFYDRVVDLRGNALGSVIVEVFQAGTSNRLYNTVTDYNGNYSIPLTGALSTNQLVDLRYSSASVATVLKQNVRLL